MINNTSAKFIFGFLAILALGIFGLLSSGYFDSQKTSVPAGNTIIQE